MEELARRQVDRHGQLAPGRRPGDLLRAGLLQHQRAQLADQAAVLADRDEDIRRDHAALGVVPAHQGLGTDDAAAGHIDPRLVMDADLPLRQRPAQLDLQLQARLRRGGHLGTEAHRAAPPGRLGAIHRQIGVAHQRVDVLAVLREDADADRRRDPQFGLRQHHRLGDQRHQPGGTPLCPRGGLAVRQQEQELVAPQPCHPLARLERIVQAPCQLHQQLVADRMAERIVDPLEMVQVDEDQRRLVAAQLAGAQRLREVLDDLVAVGQAGELVMVGEVLRLGLGLLQAADVDLGDQQRAPAGHRIAAQPCRQIVPALARRGAHPRDDLAFAADLQRGDQIAQVLAVDQPGRQPLRTLDHAGARGRIAVERTAGTAVQRRHHLGVQQRVDAAQRVRRRGRCFGSPGVAQHRHAAVVEPPAAEVDPQRDRHAGRIQRPLLAEALAGLEVGLVLAQPPRHRHRHGPAHVAGAQVLEAACLPHPHRLGIGPVHPAAVDVEDPHRMIEPVEQRCRVDQRGLEGQGLHRRTPRSGQRLQNDRMAVPRRRASAGGDAERVRGGLNATGCASAHVSYLPAPIGARRAEQPGNGRRLPRSIPPGRSEQICGN